VGNFAGEPRAGGSFDGLPLAVTWAAPEASPPAAAFNPHHTYPGLHRASSGTGLQHHGLETPYSHDGRLLPKACSGSMGSLHSANLQTNGHHHYTHSLGVSPTETPHQSPDIPHGVLAAFAAAAPVELSRSYPPSYYVPPAPSANSPAGALRRTSYPSFATPPAGLLGPVASASSRLNHGHPHPGQQPGQPSPAPAVGPPSPPVEAYRDASIGW